MRARGAALLCRKERNCGLLCASAATAGVATNAATNPLQRLKTARYNRGFITAVHCLTLGVYVVEAKNVRWHLSPHENFNCCTCAPLQLISCSLARTGRLIMLRCASTAARVPQ
eukprot:16252-Heterococcus_DN1.PRE.1